MNKNIIKILLLKGIISNTIVIGNNNNSNSNNDIPVNCFILNYGYQINISQIILTSNFLLTFDKYAKFNQMYQIVNSSININASCFKDLVHKLVLNNNNKKNNNNNSFQEKDFNNKKESADMGKKNSSESKHPSLSWSSGKCKNSNQFFQDKDFNNGGGAGGGVGNTGIVV